MNGILGTLVTFLAFIIVGWLLLSLLDKLKEKAFQEDNGYGIAIDIEQMADNYLERVKHQKGCQPYNNNDDINTIVYNTYKAAAFDVMNEINKKIAENKQDQQSDDNRNS